MNNVNVEFNVKLDKTIYEKHSKTRDDFFNKLVVNYIASDYEFMERLSKQKDNGDKYVNYLETLKHMKKSIHDSITYEVINVLDNIEEIKVKFNFPYYENSVSSLNDTVIIEVFNRNIKSNNFLAGDIRRFENQCDKEKLESAIIMYTHVGSFLEEAKSTLIINGNIVDLSEKTEPKKEKKSK